MDTLLFVLLPLKFTTEFLRPKSSPLNSSEKYLKSLSDKFLTNESRNLLLHQTYLFSLLLNDCHNPLDYEILQESS